MEGRDTRKGGREKERGGEAEAVFQHSAADSSAAFGSCHNFYPDCFSNIFFISLSWMCRSDQDALRNNERLGLCFFFNESHSTPHP